MLGNGDEVTWLRVSIILQPDNHRKQEVPFDSLNVIMELSSVDDKSVSETSLKSPPPRASQISTIIFILIS